MSARSRAAASDGRVFRLAAAVLVAVLAAGVVVALVGGQRTKGATAYFTQVTNLFPGDEVRVMGVPVGHVTAVAPEPGRVRVDLEYDADAPVPADAGAAVMAPTLVSGRFVQLAPARPDGPRLADGAVIGLDRTIVPVEWNEITEQLDRLTQALGPQGANADGSLDRLLGTAAANLDGNGEDLRATIASLSRAVGTLSDGREDLFGTVQNLQTVVSALAASDAQVDRFNTQLAAVSDQLAGSSADLGRMLDVLDSSVARIGAFVRDNRDRLSGDLDVLQKVAANLADNRQALADVLQVAPTAVSNFHNIYDPLTGGITGAFALANMRDPANFLCASIFSAGGTPEQCKQAIGPLAEVARMDYPPVRANPLQRNGAANQIDSAGAPAPAPQAALAPPAIDDKPGPSGLSSLLAPGGTR
jgi:phospholipid/cholesterol/gamma-HCH transport system substrate-binding protein